MVVKVKARPRIGLALGSGSARGWAHIGVIKALAEAGIEADIVCGSSVGALVGAALVTGSIDALEDWTRRITWREMVRFLDFRPAGGGLITGKRLMKLFRSPSYAAAHQAWLALGDDEVLRIVRECVAVFGSVRFVVRGPHRRLPILAAKEA